MTRVLLIRHGESEANRQGVFAGHYDPDLQDQGVIQAQVTAKYIAENYSVDKIYASDLIRAYKTAEALGEQLGLCVIKDSSLREIRAGEWEKLPFSELVKQYPEAFSVWSNQIAQAYCPGGETVQQVGERIMAALTRLAEKNEGRTIAVATHATPIRVMQSLVTTGGLDEMGRIPWVSNASVSVYEYDAGCWRLIAASLDEHLGKLKTELPDNV